MQIYVLFYNWNDGLSVYELYHELDQQMQWRVYIEVSMTWFLFALFREWITSRTSVRVSFSRPPECCRMDWVENYSRIGEVLL